jgi:hypothetical protein
MQRIKVEVQGITPLLLNQLTPAQLELIRTRSKVPKSKDKEITPREEAEPKVHRTLKGEPCVPAEMLLATLVAAGRFIRLDGKRQLSTDRGSLIPGLLTIETPECVLVPSEWEVDMRPGRNPNGGEAVCIVRPRFDVWGFKLSFLFDEKALSERTCRELFDIALGRVGLGDFRPARKGPFGRSVVKCWKNGEHVNAI